MNLSAPSPEVGIASRVLARTLIARIAALLCGLLLLASSGLKLYGLNYASFTQYGQLLSPTLQSFAMVWEVLLGIWLLSGSNRFLAWLAALATFIGFSIVSGYLGVIGQSNCGCFGVIQASPWAAFALDLAVIGLLVFGRPPWSGWAEISEFAMWTAGLFCFSAVLLLCVYFYFGSSSAALARLKGEVLGISPGAIDYGTGRPAETMVAKVVVKNWSDRTVRILHGTSDCTCVATHTLPAEVAAYSHVELTLSIKLPQKSGRLVRNIRFITDSQDQPVFFLNVSADVVE